MSPWKQASEAVIREVSERMRAELITDPKAILLEIDAAYPFGQRAHFPYKMWCKCRREWMVKHGLPVKVSPLKKLHRANESFVCDVHRIICKGVCLLCRPDPTGNGGY
jgi:hypothetical protein